jgi:hypothetical protein
VCTYQQYRSTELNDDHFIEAIERVFSTLKILFKIPQKS